MFWGATSFNSAILVGLLFMIDNIFTTIPQQNDENHPNAERVHAPDAVGSALIVNRVELERY